MGCSCQRGTKGLDSGAGCGAQRPGDPQRTCVVQEMIAVDASGQLDGIRLGYQVCCLRPTQAVGSSVFRC